MEHPGVTRIPLRTVDLAVARKLHPTEGLTVITIIVVLLTEAIQAHTITIILHLLTEHQAAARMPPPPPPMDALAATMITKSLPTDPPVARTVAAITTLPNTGLPVGPATMRDRAMVAGVETGEGMRKNQVDMATNVRLSSFF